MLFSSIFPISQNVFYPLTLYHTTSIFNIPQQDGFENIVGKEENVSNVFHPPQNKV